MGQARRGSPTPSFGPDIFGWGGGRPLEGVGAKKLGTSFDTQGNRTFWRDIPRDIPGRPKSLKKKSVFNFRTLMGVGVQIWRLAQCTLEGPRPLQGSLGPFGSEMPRTQSVSRKLWGTGRVFSDCPRDLLETFRGPMAGGSWRHFRGFCGISGPEDLRDPCNLLKGRAGSQGAHQDGDQVAFLQVVECLLLDVPRTVRSPIVGTGLEKKNWIQELIFGKGNEDSNLSVFRVRWFTD